MPSTEQVINCTAGSDLSWLASSSQIGTSRAKKGVPKPAIVEGGGGWEEVSVEQ